MTARQLFEERQVRRGELVSDASSITAFTWPSKSTGSTITLRGARVTRPAAIVDQIRGNVARAACAAVSPRIARRGPRRRGSAAAHRRRSCPHSSASCCRRAVARSRSSMTYMTPCCAFTSGASSASSIWPTVTQIALALHHAAELREVRLQPVLLGVALGRRAQVADHRVDVVLEFGHFAARVDLDRARQVALRHGGRHFRDRAHLGREVRREQVHVRGQVLPGARGAGHVAPGRRGALRRPPRAPPSSPGRRTSRACRSCC